MLGKKITDNKINVIYYKAYSLKFTFCWNQILNPSLLKSIDLWDHFSSLIENKLVYKNISYQVKSVSVFVIYLGNNKRYYLFKSFITRALNGNSKIREEI